MPYVTFFHSLLKIMAPEYFEKQEPCLEAACNDIDRWPTPHPGRILTLPIMGVVIKVRIPTSYDKPGTSQLVQSAQMLWELVLLGEALVVMAPSPAESSDTVLALVSCISPLRYCSDFRPYFTIHDSEFKEYTTRTQAPPSVILGVTNPFFAKTLQHWPHIIRIGDMKQAGEMAKQMKVKKLKNLKTLDSKPELTQSFIIPLKSISPWKSPPQLRPHFLKSPNFDGWFRNRRREMTHKLEALHLEALCEEDLQQRVQMHSEVETVDLVLKLKDKLSQAERDHLPVRLGTLSKLRAHIEAVILALPEDLQGILHKPSTP
ncbi:hypothetical protein FQN60_009401 [Etheostoma spectabile]|uniref:UDENN domain-containing protein n=1 Tax=Etheostoma spectabile TaxID=54343 RepID=A0A5J5DIW5_9PERO|nr:hypothetical protein FQN60_009401 [Etheostoma spectabile]